MVDLKAQYARLKAPIDARIARVLDHGQFILGPEVTELEDALASRAGVRHCVTVSSGTDALLAALMAEGVGAGDAVFVPAFTFPATAEVVCLLGASPVFVDVDPRSFNIDPDDLDRRIAETAKNGDLRARAVIVVDLYGLPADYARLREICTSYDLFLLADAAQSFGAELDGRPVGSLAPATAVSFFPAKPLGGYGDGGAILTDDDERAALFRSIRGHGKGTTKYEIERVGLNARLDTIQAAILLAKLEAFDSELANREQAAEAYDAHLTGTAAVLPARRAGARSAWAQYTIQVEKRDALADALKVEGIPSAVYYPKPLHRQTAYRQFGPQAGGLPVSEQLCARVLSLPMHPDLTREICRAIVTQVVVALETAPGI
jgi:dTDP-4-amino-4,6-dideoxygalactose transaminase